MHLSVGFFFSMSLSILQITPNYQPICYILLNCFSARLVSWIGSEMGSQQSQVGSELEESDSRNQDSSF